MVETTFEYCESCGKRFLKEEDRCGKKICEKWCSGCCNPDGTHKTHEEIKKNFAKFIMSPDGYKIIGEKITTEEEAEKLADEYLKNMPAWAEKKE